MSFWNTIKKPILALAPMYDVTDAAFRQIIVECGKPDVMYTEFVSADGLCHADAREKLIKLHLTFEENERPIVAQLFGANPDTIQKATAIIQELGFDGVDINMGCPDKAVVKSGQGAALINTPLLAREIIAAAREGAGNIPVSIKTRIGFNTDSTEEWMNVLAQERPDAIIVHGRTKKEMSAVPAHWDAIARAVQTIRTVAPDTVVLGNGDVINMDEAREKTTSYGVDGVMIGRGVFGNPWIFSGAKQERSIQERLELLVRHAELYDHYFLGIKSPHVFKQHIKNYISGFSGAHELRAQMMEESSTAAVRSRAQQALKEIV